MSHLWFSPWRRIADVINQRESYEGVKRCCTTLGTKLVVAKPLKLGSSILDTFVFKAKNLTTQSNCTRSGYDDFSAIFN